MKIRFLILFFIFFTSCSQRQPLGTKDHLFGRKGKHIVWIQVAGLEPEHLSLLKFDKETASSKIAFEEMECVGSKWSFNLYDLRPGANKGFLAQILGSQNIKGECRDFDRKTVWDYFSEQGYSVGVYEGPQVKRNSLLNFKDCPTDLKPLRNTYVWSQSQGKEGELTFHYQEGTGLSAPGVYYDKSCQANGCFVPLKTNVQKIWKGFSDKNAKSFFTLRIFSLEKALKDKNLTRAKEILKDLDELVAYYTKEAKLRSILLVISSSGSLGLELPGAGPQWAEYVKKGRHVTYRKLRTQSPVWAYGEGSENFCGIYEEQEMLTRFLWMPERDLLNFSF